LPKRSIAPPTEAVKRTLSTRIGDRGPQAQEPGQPTLPDVLGKMPPSCRAVFAAVTALASEDHCTKTTVCELSRLTRFSRRQVRRALIRLHAAHLIRWQGASRGRGATGAVELLWVSFPQEKWASRSQADYPVEKRTSEPPICSEKHKYSKEPSGLTSPLNWNQAFSKNAKGTRQIEPGRPVWPDAAPWCTRWVWSSLAGQVRRRAIELWGPYGDVATDGILSTAARAVRAGLIETEDELRGMIRYLGGRLRESGHAVEILRDRPRAFAYLGAVARRWLRRRGRLEAPAPEAAPATDWPKWQEVAFEVLEQLSWTWERRSKPLGAVDGIVAKVRKAWEETPPDRLHRRGWELLEAVSLRGFYELEEARWLVIAGLADALGVPVPEPPRRDPYEHETPEQEARRLLSSIVFSGGGDLT